MSTHNICFRGEIRKISAFFGRKKVPYLLLCLKIMYEVCCVRPNMGCSMQKCVLGHMWTAKAEISLPIHSLIRAFSVCLQNRWILQNV